jgi:SNW domain-containing protein 1
LYIADRHAREEVKLRAEMQAKLVEKEKKEKENRLRELAQRARQGIQRQRDSEDDNHSHTDDTGSESDDYAQREREKIRLARQKQHEKEIRMNAKSNGNRDISEKVALGVQKPKSRDTMYDSRLFNTEAGMSSGFKDDDLYGTFFCFLIIHRHIR